MPEALAAGELWIILIVFMLGGIFAVGVDAGMDLVRTPTEQAEESAAGAWGIYFGGGGGPV